MQLILSKVIDSDNPINFSGELFNPSVENHLELVLDDNENPCDCKWINQIFSKLPNSTGSFKLCYYGVEDELGFWVWGYQEIEPTTLSRTVILNIDFVNYLDDDIFHEVMVVIHTGDEEFLLSKNFSKVIEDLKDNVTDFESFYKSYFLDGVILHYDLSEKSDAIKRILGVSHDHPYINGEVITDVK